LTRPGAAERPAGAASREGRGAANLEVRDGGRAIGQIEQAKPIARKSKG